MRILLNFVPDSLYNSIHELVRMAFPDWQVSCRPADDDARLDMQIINQTEGVSIKGSISSPYGNTVLENYYPFDRGAGDTANQARKYARVLAYELLSRHVKKNINLYGILTGMRPVKLLHRFMDRGESPEMIKVRLEQEYRVDREKAGLLVEIAANNRGYLLNSGEAEKVLSIYIGIPYCPSRCYYCSFPGAILSDYERDIKPFLEALMLEIQVIGSYLKESGIIVQAVYIGGGTPTVLSADDFEKLFALLHKYYISAKTAEITVEAGRPDTLDPGKLKTLKNAGVSRICINPQTMNDSTLARIGRNHDEKGVVQSYYWVRESGIPKINMDLIVGLPGEGIHQNTYTAEKVRQLKPENVTVHTLALKRGSAMAVVEARENNQEKIVQVSRGIKLFSTVFRERGYMPYYLYRQKYMKASMENIGYSLKDSFCLYNIQMIEERQTIIGMGGGAASKIINSYDWSLSSLYNPRNPQAYIGSVEKLVKRKVDKLRGLN